MNPPEIRQAMACGWEPSLEGSHGWRHRGMEAAPAVCPGYLCKLPEVVEVSRMRAHWKHGALREALGEHEPNRQLMDLVLTLDEESSRVESWAMTPKSKGGGRAD